MGTFKALVSSLDAVTASMEALAIASQRTSSSTASASGGASMRMGGTASGGGGLMTAGSSSSPAEVEQQATRVRTALEELLAVLDKVDGRAGGVGGKLEQLGALLGSSHGAGQREPGWWAKTSASSGASSGPPAPHSSAAANSGGPSGGGGLLQAIASAHGDLSALADAVDVTHSWMPQVKDALDELRRQVNEHAVSIPGAIEKLKSNGSLLSKEVLEIVSALKDGGSNLERVITRLQDFRRRHPDTAAGVLAGSLDDALRGGAFSYP